MIHRRLAIYLSIALLLGPLAGCGDDGEGPEVVTADMLTGDGWAGFEAGRIEEALADFLLAIGIDVGYGEAHSGAGWCLVRMDSPGQALDHFNAAISNGVTHADPRAGKAVIYRDLEPVDFQLAIAWADSALYIDPAYVFAHDESLDWRDLRLILAHSFVAVGDYTKAKFQVDLLNPANALDPESATFVEDLIAEIERLGEG